MKIEVEKIRGVAGERVFRSRLFADDGHQIEWSEGWTPQDAVVNLQARVGYSTGENWADRALEWWGE